MFDSRESITSVILEMISAIVVLSRLFDSNRSLAPVSMDICS